MAKIVRLCDSIILWKVYIYEDFDKKFISGLLFVDIVFDFFLPGK